MQCNNEFCVKKHMPNEFETDTIRTELKVITKQNSTTIDCFA